MTPEERYTAITTWRRIKETQRVKECRLDRYEREMKMGYTSRENNMDSLHDPHNNVSNNSRRRHNRP